MILCQCNPYLRIGTKSLECSPFFLPAVLPRLPRVVRKMCVVAWKCKDEASMPRNWYGHNNVNIMACNFFGKLSRTQPRGTGQPHEIKKDAQKGFYMRNLPWTWSTN